jgi:hypothetical protein
MKDSKFYKKFNNCCFELSAEDIFDLNKNDNGPVNNVIARIDRHCYGVKLYDDEYGLTAEMFYVNNDNTLKGDIIKIEITDFGAVCAWSKLNVVCERKCAGETPLLILKREGHG